MAFSISAAAVIRRISVSKECGSKSGKGERLLYARLVAQIDAGTGAGKLGKPLTAAAAGRAKRQFLGNDGDFDDLALTGHDHMADRSRFGAPALRKGQVLDIGTGIDPAILGADSGPDREFRIGRMGFRHRHAGRLEKFVFHGQRSFT